MKRGLILVLGLSLFANAVWAIDLVVDNASTVINESETSAEGPETQRSLSELDRSPAVYFALPSGRSQDKPIERGLIPFIDGLTADDTLHIMQYVFTHDGLGEAVKRALDRGVDVRLMVDRRQACRDYSEVGPLSRAGATVWMDTLSGSYFHHKVAVAGDVVWTGSFNWSASAAEDNFENLVRLVNERMAERYRAMFEQMTGWFLEMKMCDDRFPVRDP